MATANVTLYSSKAAARKGAKRAGLLSFAIISAGKKFKFVNPADAIENANAVEQSVLRPKKEKAARGPTKVGRVIEMCQNGTTIDEITKALGVSRAAAQSLIQDARKKGVTIKMETSPAGANVYRLI